MKNLLLSILMLSSCASFSVFADDYTCYELENSVNGIEMEEASRLLSDADKVSYELHFPNNILMLEEEASKVCFKPGGGGFYMTLMDTNGKKLVSFDGALAGPADEDEKYEVTFIERGMFGMVFWKEGRLFDTTELFQNPLLISPNFSELQLHKKESGKYEAIGVVEEE